MQLKQLAYFVAVVEAQSFSSAAKKLYITQPTLSQSIHALEEELGFELLVRNRNCVALSEMGRIVFQDAEKLLEETRKMQEKWTAVDQKRKSLTGTVRLVVYPSAYSFVTDQIVSRGHDLYPNMHWQVSEARGSCLPDLFSNRQIDLGIGDYITIEKDSFLENASAQGLRIMPLCGDICRIAISNKNPLSKKVNLTSEDAKTLTLAYYSGGDDVVIPYFLPYFDKKSVISLHSFEKIVDVAVHDIAVSPVAQKMASQGLLRHYAQDAVKFLTVEDFDLPVTHCLIYASDTVFVPELEAAREFLVNVFHELELLPL